MGGGATTLQAKLTALAVPLTVYSLPGHQYLLLLHNLIKKSLPSGSYYRPILWLLLLRLLLRLAVLAELDSIS